MELGMIGLGRMGANMAARLAAGGHECVVYDRDPAAAEAAAGPGVTPAASLDALVGALGAPRRLWLMVPAAAVDVVLDELVPRLAPGDVVVDGGNSDYRDSVRRAGTLAGHGIACVDVGTSGGVFGRELGFCLMVGGDADAVAGLAPAFDALVDGERARAAWLRCGPSGAGHFVKMVHNGIEYGLMQAYAEGLNLLARADGEDAAGRESDAAAAERFDFDVAAIAELWRHGSVVRSWLLDLTAGALAADPKLEGFSGAVADSGEGRWMLEAAAARGIPVPALTAALFARFASRGQADYGDRVLSAMRKAFGGHVEPGKP